MNTTQLECFLEVANCLNFSRAAERLNITQPAVSHQIHTLENELGVKLFQRTSKSVRLTQEGYLFTEYAGEILRLSNLSRARMKESRGEAPLRLVIGCRNAAELGLVRPALRRRRALRPEVLPVLRLIPSDALDSLLSEGQIHLVFSLQGTSVSRARFLELARCSILCVCDAAHPLAGLGRVTLQQLQSAGAIAACRPPACPPDLFAVQSQVVGGRPANRLLFCDSQEAVLTLVSAGYGFGLTVDYPHSRLADLCYLPLEGVEPLSFGAVYLPDSDSALLQQFLRLLAESMTPPEGGGGPAEKAEHYAGG